MLLNADRNTDIERGIDRDAVLHSGKEAPLLQRIEENSIQPWILGRLGERYCHCSVIRYREMRDCLGLERLLAEFIRDYRSGAGIAWHAMFTCGTTDEGYTTE